MNSDTQLCYLLMLKLCLYVLFLLKNVFYLFLFGQIRFNKDGDAYGFYNIYQYQYLEDKQKYDYVPIGTWKEGYVFDVTFVVFESALSILLIHILYIVI